MIDRHRSSRLPDREVARRVAARFGLAGVPVSMREPADQPGTGVGTGHWLRHVERLSAAVERCGVAVAQLPAGGVREELEQLVHVLELRLGRYVRMAEVGQALLPDDDTTDLDGTAPGMRPFLDGAPSEIDARLEAALAHLTCVAGAVDLIVLAAAGQRDAEQVTVQVDRLVAGMSAP